MNKIFSALSLSCFILLVGCAQPSVRNGTLIQYPTNKVHNLYIDTSGTNVISIPNSWPRKVAPEFKTAVPIVFAQYGVNAQVLELKNESILHNTSNGDYILEISFANGTYGSYGVTSTYLLNLFSAKNKAKIWSGFISGSGSTTIATENLGGIIAKNIADSMNSAKLFSDDFVQQHPTATGAPQKQNVLSGKTLEAFQKFKLLKFPKAFVIGDDDTYVYEGWQPGVDTTPAERALAKCEQKQFKNCHVISDGDQIF